MAKFCTKCGASMDGGIFCSECGHQARKPAAGTQQSEPQAATVVSPPPSEQPASSSVPPPFPGQSAQQTAAPPPLPPIFPGQSSQSGQAGSYAGDVGKKAGKFLADAELKTNMNKQRLIIGALAIVGILFMLFPWVTFMGESANAFGIGGPMWLVFGFFAGTIVVCLLGDRKKTLGKKVIATSIFGGLAALIIIMNIITVNAEISQYGGMTSSLFSLSFAIYFTAFIGIVLLAIPIVGKLLANRNQSM